MTSRVSTASKVAATVASQEWRSTVRTPSAMSFSDSPGVEARVTICSARAAASPGRKRRPLRPSSMISLTEPPAAPMTGQPSESACRISDGKLCPPEGSMKALAARRYSIFFGWGRAPTKVARLLSIRVSPRALSAGKDGPSPMMARWQSRRRRETAESTVSKAGRVLALMLPAVTRPKSRG